MDQDGKIRMRMMLNMCGHDTFICFFFNLTWIYGAQNGIRTVLKDKPCSVGWRIVLALADWSDLCQVPKIFDDSTLNKWKCKISDGKKKKRKI